MSMLKRVSQKVTKAGILKEKKEENIKKIDPIFFKKVVTSQPKNNLTSPDYNITTISDQKKVEVRPFKQDKSENQKTQKIENLVKHLEFSPLDNEPQSNKNNGIEDDYDDKSSSLQDLQGFGELQSLNKTENLSEENFSNYERNEVDDLDDLLAPENETITVESSDRCIKSLQTNNFKFGFTQPFVLNHSVASENKGSTTLTFLKKGKEKFRNSL